MTGSEFKNNVVKYLTDKNITVSEHEHIFKDLKRVAFKTIDKVIYKYWMYFDHRYDVNFVDEHFNVYDVEFSKERISFIYWDDYSCDTSSSLKIPMDDFIKWIDNDVSEIENLTVDIIKNKMRKTVDYNNAKIEQYAAEREEIENILSKIDKMKFGDIDTWYNEWIDNAI